MTTTERAFTYETQANDREGLISNLSAPERWVSALGGCALAVYGMTREGYGGTALALLGGALIYRGVTGHSFIYSGLRINTSNRKGRAASVKHGGGIRIEKSVIIDRSPEELYRFWRKLENLPRFMNHLESVTQLGNNRYHWVAKAPAGMTAEWDAEVYNEKENRFIAWRSLEGSQIPNAGSVHFERAPGGRGTEVKVEINYAPPGGRIGHLVATIFGENPNQQIEEDLARFKQIMEDVSSRSQTTGR
ncbi:MAG TPA: SRPBCC family protein [Blastocatellia bacterium]|nr:SRPBCC family protein [Blastocatellia bacterium]